VLAVLAATTTSTIGCTGSAGDESQAAPAATAATAPIDDWPDTGPTSTGDLLLRDSFIVADPEAGYYYLTGTGPGFRMWRSTDLEQWYGPKKVFDPPDQDALDESVVAGTTILVADELDGPYEPLIDGPITPTDRFAIDATLVTDDDGAPWIVYVKESIDPRSNLMGSMATSRLTEDLTARAGDETELFDAQAPPWAGPLPLAIVTDGPWVERLDSGELVMLWSGVGYDSPYVTGTARSESGEIEGPWVQDCELFFAEDGGRPMLFRRFDGQLMVVLHAPDNGETRPVIAPVIESDGKVMIDPAAGLPTPSDERC
jgi:hypothetical protein